MYKIHLMLKRHEKLEIRRKSLGRILCLEIRRKTFCIFYNIYKNIVKRYITSVNISNQFTTLKTFEKTEKTSRNIGTYLQLSYKCFSMENLS